MRMKSENEIHTDAAAAAAGAAASAAAPVLPLVLLWFRQRQQQKQQQLQQQRSLCLNEKLFLIPFSLVSIDLIFLVFFLINFAAQCNSCPACLSEKAHEISGGEQSV